MIKGFSNYKSDNSYNQNYGVIIYINNKYNVSVEQMPLFSEASCLKINIKNNDRPITILATYRSPQTNINLFLAELAKVVTTCSIHINCIWIGDIYIDMLE